MDLCAQFSEIFLDMNGRTFSLPRLSMYGCLHDLPKRGVMADVYVPDEELPIHAPEHSGHRTMPAFPHYTPFRTDSVCGIVSHSDEFTPHQWFIPYPRLVSLSLLKV
jgi:hypothetical protein